MEKVMKVELTQAQFQELQNLLAALAGTDENSAASLHEAIAIQTGIAFTDAGIKAVVKGYDLSKIAS